jgi:cytochrome c oxidase subunit 1
MQANTAAGPNPEPSFLETPTGWKSWAFTLDHKRIGVMYLFSTIFAFFIGGLFAILVRLEHLTPTQTLLTADQYNQAFTLHGAIMVFLFIIPSIPGGLGNIFLPIMIGAKDVAFPKLNLLSYYFWVCGAIFTVTAICTGGIDTGWTFYTPYSSTTNTSVIWMGLGVFILGFSSILTGINFIVTLHRLRAPGMGWYKMPLFLWALYATALIQILATPVLAITISMLAVERAFGLGIFDAKLGGDPILFQHFFWFYSHPAVYIMILPGMGIISEIIATFSRRHLFGYKAIAYSSVALAILGFLVWGHHLFVSGQSEFATVLFSFLTFFVAIPSGVKLFNWLATLYKGSISLETPMLYALYFIFLFAIGGLTGIFLGALATDVHLTDTYFVVAHFHYVMMGGTIIAFVGGLHYWWPKITGKMYNERLAQVTSVFVFIGFNVTFFTQFILGTRGMPRRYYNYPPEFQTLHIISTVGSWILLLSFLTMLGYFIVALRSGKKAPANPWGALGLEWTTQSPPYTENFHETPVVSHGPYDYDDPAAAQLIFAKEGA